MEEQVIKKPKKAPVLKEDPGFAYRMKQACDRNPRVPPEKEGRLVWIMNELQTQYELDVVLQSVHRWYHGRARPRAEKMVALCKLLDVDLGWLSAGVGAILSNEDKAAPSPMVSDGAANVVAGLMQMSNINCAWPEIDDPARDYVHFYAIIRGKQHRFHVLLIDENKEGEQTLRLPMDFARCSILVVRRVAASSLDVWYLPLDKIAEKPIPRGGFAELSANIKGSSLYCGDQKLAAIKNWNASVG